MSERTLLINFVSDSKSQIVSYSHTTTAEDVCIFLCKQLGVAPVARHLFALRDAAKQTFLMPASTFPEKNPSYDLRIRFKPSNIKRLRDVDRKAYDYYFHQARCDVLENKIPDLVYEKYKNELLGLGVADMYRVMLEKDLPRESVENDYRKYIPKEALKRHSIFIKKPIHESLGKIKKAGHNACYVKGEYLKQLDLMAPEYLAEEYKAITDHDGNPCTIYVRVSPYHLTEPGIKMSFESKRETWQQICTIEELCYISVRKDGTVEISRKNGIPFYLKFYNIAFMLSFVSLLDGYYRLTCKWIFNICKDVPTPSLQKLYSMKCHGPVGGEFSYAKLEEKRGNRPGCFILRESETKYNAFYIDACMRESMKPKTFKLERLSDDEFIFNDDLTRYTSIHQLMTAYNNPQDEIYLHECLPPSEYDNSPLLLCQSNSIAGDSLADSSAIQNIIPTQPLCISNKDIQVYKGKKCLKWNKSRNKVKHKDSVVKQDKFDEKKFPDESISKAKKYCRNPNGDVGGPWCFVEIEEGNVVEQEYCDIPFCDEEDCTFFSKNFSTYSHYINFNEALRNITFGLKIWDSDSYHTASARLVLSVLSLPFTGKQIQDSGIGIEITITNKLSALTGGNKDMPEFESSIESLKGTQFTFFSLTWTKGFISLNKEGQSKPIFLAEFKTRNNLLGFLKDKFRFYSVQGINVLWSFPFCDDDGSCDVHTTTSYIFQKFWALRETQVGHDLQFYVRAFHSAYIRLAASPAVDFPYVEIMLNERDNYTRIVSVSYEGAARHILKEITIHPLLSYWKWTEFSVSLFADTLQIHLTKDARNHLIIEVKHNLIKKMRWFSPSSYYTVSHWTFYCVPPKFAKPRDASPPECALNTNEPEYKGTQWTTSTGLPCAPWSSLKLLPDSGSLLYSDKNALILKDLNYCRDPKVDLKGTFCYAISQEPDLHIEKRKCNIRKCKSAECKMAGTGNDYIGKLSITRSNRTCHNWVQHIVKNNLTQDYLNETLYPDMSAENAENFCRNPSRSIAGQKKEGSEGITVTYRSMWRLTKGKKIEVAMKVLKHDSCEKYLKDFLELTGHWAFLQSSSIVRLYGITMTSPISMVLEYMRLGPLDQFLRSNKSVLKPVDLVEASSNLASALWHLEENGIVHGNIRCKKLLVSCHEENAFTVKLGDPGIHHSYAPKDVHWIPVECYSNFEFAKKSIAADVWAFATTVWEIFMYGEEINPVDHLDAMRFYANGKRLTQPSDCPSDVYQILKECWDPDPHRRKQPQALMRDINQILYQVYNSRRVHSYSKVLAKSNYGSQSLASASSISSITSNVTASTAIVGYQDELVSICDMNQTDNELSNRSNSKSSNSEQPWRVNLQEQGNNEDTLSCDFSNVFSSFNFSMRTSVTSLDSISSMQSIFELDADCNVILQGRIGQGFYGEVYKGTLEYLGDKDCEPRKVAVKKLKTTAATTCLQDFEREISIMKTLKHPNIVEILGVLQEPEVSLVMEFVQHGSLQSYLKIYRESLSIKQLLKYALDIARGMDYLDTKHIVHRDLAARNILVVDENHVKISDFGLAQVMGTNEYYILKTNRELPIKWYAPESLRDGKFSSPSDVWSYGVTMCEMFGHGEEPKLVIMNADKQEGQEQQILLNAIESGSRFPCPMMCPQVVYVRLIYPCWKSDPHERPRFYQLCKETEDLLLQY